MQKLGKRLSLIASFTAAGSSVCDVGCDHGYLSAFLCLRGDLKGVIATDINEKPIKNAQNTFKKYGITGVKLIKTDGLSGIDRSMADTVIISGLGGDVISGIIDRAPFLKDSTVSLILQPMTSVSVLRQYLAENGFFVTKESAVSENGKVYSVMSVCFDGKIRTLNEVKKRIGEIKPETEDDAVYIKRQVKLCEEYISNIEKAKGKEKELLLARETVNNLKQILKGENNGI